MHINDFDGISCSPMLPVNGAASQKPRPFTEHYIAMPADFVAVCKETNLLKKDMAPRERKSGKGTAGQVIGARHPWLLAAMYRMYRKETGVLYVDPQLLAHASGWSVQAIQRELNAGPLNRWARFDPRSATAHRDGENRWIINLTPVPDGDFLRLPAWWLWQPPQPGAEGKERFVRRAWERRSPALLVSLALLRVVSYETWKTDRYGVGGIMTLTGLSRSTVERGLAEAWSLGFIASENRLGGARNATRLIRTTPQAPIGGLHPDWFTGSWKERQRAAQGVRIERRDNEEPTLFPLAL